MTVWFLVGWMIGAVFCMATMGFWFAFINSVFDRGLWKTIKLTPRVIAHWRRRSRP